MLSKDQSQQSSSSSEAKAGAAAAADAIARGSIDTAADGGGTVNDPPPVDHRPPSGYADLDRLA